MNETPDDLLTAGEAAAYLARKWGRDVYTTVAFRQLRHRWNLQPALLLPTASLWRRGDLDAIPQPSRHNPRPRQSNSRKDSKDDEKTLDTEEHAMLLLA